MSNSKSILSAARVDELSGRLRQIFERDGAGQKEGARSLLEAANFEGAWNYLIRSLLEAASMEIVCIWTDQDDYYATSCGHAFWLSSPDSPGEHGMRFCHACGGQIVVNEISEDENE